MRTRTPILSLVCVSLVAACLVFVGQSDAGSIDPETIVGTWLFDDDPNDGVQDSSGNGNDGEIIGDVEWVADGKFGKGLLFPGEDENYVEVPHNESLDLTTFSFTAWVKIEPTGTYQSILIKTADGSVENYSGYIMEGSGVFWTRFTSGGAGQWGFQKWGVVTATDNEWHHVAGTYDMGSVKTYIDGSIEAEPEFDGEPDLSPGPLNLGDCPGYPYAVNGVMDDIGLFNVALSQDEIIDIMENGLTTLLAVDPAGKLATIWGSIKQ